MRYLSASLLTSCFLLFSCNQRTPDQGYDTSVPAADTLRVMELKVKVVERDTVEFEELLREYYEGLPDVGDTAIWGTWEEYQNPEDSLLDWEELKSGGNEILDFDSTGLPAPLHFSQPSTDSAFYLPTAQHWVRCNTSYYSEEDLNYYFYQGYIPGLGVYFFPGCSVRIGGTCDYYLLDSLSSAVRVVRCEYDNPYRYVAWSKQDSLLMFVANDGFSSAGMLVKILEVTLSESQVNFNHVLQEQFGELTASDLRILPEGGFALRIVQNTGSDQAEEVVWRKVLIGRG